MRRRWNNRRSNMSADTEKLRLWLIEWRVERMLNEDDTDELPGNRTAVSTSAGTLVSAEPGQIYLLAPDTASSARRPRYMVILNRRGDGAFLMAPFGRLGVPATQGEIRTGRRAVHLRVLCLWNARWVRKVDLLGGWRVASLSKKELSAVMNVYRAVPEDAPIPDSLQDRVGPCLGHPLDPRHQYVDEEMRWLDEYLERSRVRGSLQYTCSASSSLSMAAESRGRYRAAGRKKGREGKKKPR